MGRFFKAFKAGVTGALSGFGPGSFAAGGRIIACSHCQRTEFQAQEAQMNSWRMSLFNLDWLNRSGVALVCTTCGLIQWFAETPERVE